MNSNQLKDQTQTEAASSGCCGGPAPAEVDACCVRDAEAKAAGKDGCGCSLPQRPVTNR